MSNDDSFMPPFTAEEGSTYFPEPIQPELEGFLPPREAWKFETEEEEKGGYWGGVRELPKALEIGPDDYPLQAKWLVARHFNGYFSGANPPMKQITVDEIYVVWFAKTLQNWKALLGTTVPDGMYYELTYDGEKKMAYLDVYKKLQNIPVPFEGLFDQYPHNDA